MALPARRGWPEDSLRTLRKAEEARREKRAGWAIGDFIIIVAVVMAYLWALDFKSRALLRLERLTERAARLEAICRRLRAEIAVLSSPTSLREAARRAGLRPPEDGGEVDFLVVAPIGRGGEEEATGERASSEREEPSTRRRGEKEGGQWKEETDGTGWAR